MFRTRWALATLLAACLLGGCSEDDPEPKVGSDPTPSESSSMPTVSPSPTVTPTVVVSPQDTVAAWIAAENEALRTGSTQALQDLAARHCRGCDNFVEPIEKVYNAGGSYMGGDWTLVNSHVESASSSATKLSAAVQIADGTTIPEAGADPVRYEAQNHLMTFELVQEGGAWRFSVVAFIS
jgi:hypothetical protein